MDQGHGMGDQHDEGTEVVSRVEEEDSCDHGQSECSRQPCCGDPGDKEELGLPRLSLKDIVPPLPDFMIDEYKQKQYLRLYPRKGCRPQVVEFSPWKAYPGSLVVILGHGFAPLREQNSVYVGTEKALVIGADRHRLVVITSYKTRDGPVVVKTRHGSAKASRRFKTSLWPAPDADGPPHSFEGVGLGEWTQPNDLLLATSESGAVASSRLTTRAVIAPSRGTAKVLVVCGHPTDKTPADEASALAVVAAKWEKARTFYRQASYNQFDIEYEVVGYFTLDQDFAYYYKASPRVEGYPNFDKAKLLQIEAEAAQYAVDQGKDLNTFHVLMVDIYMDTFIRAWGGGTLDTAIDFADLSIHIPLSRRLGTIAFGDNNDPEGTPDPDRKNATWGRITHEFGHNIVATPLVLGEDVYPDGIPGTDATAQRFEMMGDHDSFPLFSGFNMENLGWYTVDRPGSPGNIKSQSWSTAPFSREIEIVAHGLSQNTNSARCHLFKIHVSDGLDYYIEVRQQPPGSSAQVFDPNIRVPSGQSGGVLVTRALSKLVNNNQSMRAITLLQSQSTTLSAGDTVVDPLRTIVITVLDDSVQLDPLVCRVRVEWAQPTSPTPSGNFDVWIKPWGAGYWTEDIWIDREGDNVYDHADASGNPIEGGDVPQLGRINQFKARIRNQGTAAATNVTASFYVNTPPGIGDSGTWTPLQTFTLGSIPAGGEIIQEAQWSPKVGEHTCLQVAIVPKPGETNFGNNLAQENIFTFMPASHSVPEPVELPVVIKNPLDRREMIFISIDGVPAGFYVYFPRRFLYLEARGEQRLELLVIPLREIPQLKAKIANIRVQGYVPHFYKDITAANGTATASTFRPIGGIQARVAPRVGAQIRLDEQVKRAGRTFAVTGSVSPVANDQAVRVDLSRDVDGRTFHVYTRTANNGTFSASFTLRELDREWTLSFQAHIFSASVLAACDSNIVHFEVQEPPDDDVPR